MPKSYYIPCGCGHVQGEHRTFMAGGCSNCACKSFALPPEDPPLTPEEEEWACANAGGCDHLLTNDCEHGCRAAADELTQLGQEAEPPSPQPDRRPPVAIAYSVKGHLYEVALPGDATVVAQDGALIITHSLGPVVGIVQARPLEGEQSA